MAARAPSSDETPPPDRSRARGRAPRRSAAAGFVPRTRLATRGVTLRSPATMAYRDLRDFLTQLESTGDLKRVAARVDPKLEMTALCDRTLRAHGPALLFENPTGQFIAPNGATIPVLGNLFGTPERVAKAMGA